MIFLSALLACMIWMSDSDGILIPGLPKRLQTVIFTSKVCFGKHQHCDRLRWCFQGALKNIPTRQEALRPLGETAGKRFGAGTRQQEMALEQNSHDWGLLPAHLAVEHIRGGPLCSPLSSSRRIAKIKRSWPMCAKTHVTTLQAWEWWLQGSLIFLCCCRRLCCHGQSSYA